MDYLVDLSTLSTCQLDGSVDLVDPSTMLTCQPVDPIEPTTLSVIFTNVFTKLLFIL